MATPSTLMATPSTLMATPSFATLMATPSFAIDLMHGLCSWEVRMHAPLAFFDRNPAMT